MCRSCAVIFVHMEVVLLGHWCFMGLCQRNISLQILPDAKAGFSGSSYPCSSPSGLLLAKLQSVFKTRFLNYQDCTEKYS